MRILSLFTLLFALIVLPAAAQTGGQVQLSAEDQVQLQRVATYLNDITTAKADFIQTSPNGNVAGGTFYLSRPGKLRFDYIDPVKDFIVADGSSIWYYDSKLKDASHTSISSTLADFLLRRTINLTGDITVLDFHRGNGLIRLMVTQTKDPGEGSLTLILNERPLQLQQWRVIDSEGKATEISLQNAQFGHPLDPQLFVFHEPKGK